VHIAEKVAQIKGIALEEVASATTSNAFEMFGL
jgi:Tat protein secretion system quality control protein TatD with DNase activity